MIYFDILHEIQKVLKNPSRRKYLDLHNMQISFINQIVIKTVKTVIK